MGATRTLKTRIAHAAKTYADWQGVTTVPKLGEVCLEIHTGSLTGTEFPYWYRVKIGDGSGSYTQLPYFGDLVSVSGSIQAVRWDEANNQLKYYQIRQVNGKIIIDDVDDLRVVLKTSGSGVALVGSTDGALATVSLVHTGTAPVVTSSVQLDFSSSFEVPVEYDERGHVTKVRSLRLPTSASIDAVSNSIATVSSSLGQISSSVSSSLAGLSSSITTVSGTLGSVSSSVSNSLTELSSSITTVSGTVGTLSSSFNSVSSSVSASLTGLSSSLGQVSSSLSSSTAELSASLAVVSGTLGDVSSSFDSVSSSVSSTLENLSSSVSSSFAQVNGSIRTVSGNLDTLSSSYTNFSTSISDSIAIIEDELVDLGVGLDQVSSALEVLSGSIPGFVTGSISSSIAALSSSVGVTGNTKVLTAVSQSGGKLTGIRETEIIGGTKIIITGSATQITFNHGNTTTIVVDSGSDIGERETEVITSMSVDAQGHVTSITKDRSTNLIAADIKEPIRVVDSGSWTYRPTGGTTNIGEDIATIQTVAGKTLVWNQLIRIFNTDLSTTANGVTFVDNRDGSYTVFTDENGATAQTTLSLWTETWNLDHRYLVMGLPADLSAGVELYISPTYWSAGVFAGGSIGVALQTVSSGISFPRIRVSSGTKITSPITVRPVVFDLTKMFGSDENISAALGVDITDSANYLQAIANFKKLYPPRYYSLTTGSLINNNAKGIESIGFNQWDEQWERGSIKSDTGTDSTDTSALSSSIRSENYTPILPNTVYYAKNPYEIKIALYGVDKNYLGSSNGWVNFSGNGIFTTPPDAYYMRFTVNNPGDYANNICINISGSTNGVYKPYQKDTLYFNGESGSLSTITGKKVGSGDSVVIFPEGLGSVDTIHDELTGLENGYLTKAIKRVGSRDYTSGDESGSFVITDGIKTNYVLGSEEIYTLDKPVPVTYPVDDLGTERRIPDDTAGSVLAPFTGQIVYQSNFKDAVKDTILKVNNYKNPVRGVSNSDQTPGTVAVYDSNSTVSGSQYIINTGSINPTGSNNGVLIPTVEQVVSLVSTGSVQDVITSDTGSGGLVTSTTGSVKNVSHKNITQVSSSHEIITGSGGEGTTSEEGVVSVLTKVSVDQYGHITGSEYIPSNKLIAADIKAPVEIPNTGSFTFRETGDPVSIGEDTARINIIEGNTLVWNQLVRNGNFETTSSWSPGNGSITASDNILTYTVTTPNQNSTSLVQYGFPDIGGHKYLFRAELMYSEQPGSTGTVFYGIGGYYGRSYPLSNIQANTWFVIKGILTSDGSSPFQDLCFYFRTQNMSVGSTVKVRNATAIDLTKMFGSTVADNMTVDDFEKLFSAPYYPYCEGRLVSLGGYGVKINQLVDTNTSTVTLTNGHKFYTVISNTESIVTGTGSSQAVTGGTDMVIDLTTMFGSGSEPYTVEEVKAILALLKTQKGITGDYIPYNTGENMNPVSELGIESVGLNQWDEQWELGAWNQSGQKAPNSTTIRSKNKLRCVSNATYYCKCGAEFIRGLVFRFFDASDNLIGSTVCGNNTFDVPDNAYSFVLCSHTEDGVTTYNNDICINFSCDRNGQYEPYKKDTVDLSFIYDLEYTPSGSSTSEKLFPYGLLSAGNVHDEVHETYAIKRVGVVDLGIFDWTYDSNNSMFWSASPIPEVVSNNLPNNILTSRYITKTTRFSQNPTGSGYIWYNDSAYSSAKRLYVRDLSYSGSSLDGSKAPWLVGNKLYYELENPIRIDFDPSINTSYTVDDKGTERLIPQNTPNAIITAPFAGQINYYSNFKDSVLKLIGTWGNYNPSNGSIIPASSFNSITIPTVEAVINYVRQHADTPLDYQGTVASISELPTSDTKPGDLWIVSAAFTYGGHNLQAGDWLVRNKANDGWDVIEGSVTVENKNAKIGVTPVEIAEVNGTSISASIVTGSTTQAGALQLETQLSGSTSTTKVPQAGQTWTEIQKRNVSAQPVTTLPNGNITIHPAYVIGTSAPGVAPDFVGQIYVRTGMGAWIAVGTTSSSDWKPITG